MPSSISFSNPKPQSSFLTQILSTYLVTSAWSDCLRIPSWPGESSVYLTLLLKKRAYFWSSPFIFKFHLIWSRSLLPCLHTYIRTIPKTSGVLSRWLEPSHGIFAPKYTILLKFHTFVNPLTSTHPSVSRYQPPTFVSAFARSVVDLLNYGFQNFALEFPFCNFIILY